MNKEIRQLEDNLIKVLNDSQLLMEIKRLVVKDILNVVTKQADQEILSEINSEKDE